MVDRPNVTTRHSQKHAYWRSATLLGAKLSAFSEIIDNIERKRAKMFKFMANKGVHGTMVHITNLHTRNLHRKVEYISQTSENSFGTLPQN